MAEIAAPSVGPILFARGADARVCRIDAIVARASAKAPGALIPAGGAPVAPERIHDAFQCSIWRYAFELPARAGAAYTFDGREFPVATDFGGDLRIAYLSCNGQEHGDDRRPLAGRNVLWRRLHDQHRSAPYHLLLHGGDQLYADEMLDQHPVLRAWRAAGRRYPVDLTQEAHQSAERFLLEHYLDVAGAPAVAELMAHVPSLMMWDDHDIMDGWGSHRGATLASPGARELFALARRYFRIFQLGIAPDGPLPPMFADPSATTLTWRVDLPGIRIVAPDLRSERQGDRVLGDAGWSALSDSLAGSRGKQRLLVLSSVPVLGPRLSWVEAFLHLFPGLQKYEDDLRDQWQSRTHRDEWRRLLELVAATHAPAGPRVVLLSGEIHLASRGELRLATDDVVHQLIASGIAHPAPPAIYARLLGMLSHFGESPVPDQSARMYPVPGATAVYTAERNYLVLSRRQQVWSAHWEREHSGATAELTI